MARPRKFDEEQVLESALLLFWRRGYAATSIQDLVQATGLGRQSLYNTFGGKQELFVAALGEYRRRVDEELCALHSPTAGRDEIRSYILGALDAQTRLGCGACLLVVTAFAPVIEDGDIRDAVHDGAESGRAAFEHALTACVAREEIEDVDLPSTAAALYAFLAGLGALRRTGLSAARCEQTLDQMLNSILSS